MTTTQTTATPATQKLGIATTLALIFLLFSGLIFSAEDVVQGSTVRIMYVHVPSIWVAYLAFALTAICSAVYLSNRSRSLIWDRFAGAAAEIGVLFVAVSLVTGSLWGRLTWGTFWVWDARLTSTAFLFITYVGYLAVRRLGGTFRQRARRSAVMALLAVLEIPLVHFSVNLWRTLHQKASIADPNAKVKLDGFMLFTLFWGLISFTMLFVWLLIHRQRLMALEDAVQDQGLDLAIQQRRTEAGR
ncbi:MAG: cytochrome C biogenesis protein [Ilumatobacteraceae bacterium]|nr:cytochrome C biogenesis protein [Ilumatobacteraceae bacterium]